MSEQTYQAKVLDAARITDIERQVKLGFVMLPADSLDLLETVKALAAERDAARAALEPFAAIVDAYPGAAKQLRDLGLKCPDEMPPTYPVKRELLLAARAAIAATPALAGGGEASE